MRRPCFSYVPASPLLELPVLGSVLLLLVMLLTVAVLAWR